MHLSRHAVHIWIFTLALLVGLVALALPKPAGAQSAGYTPGYYTTTSSSTTSSSTNATTGVTTSTTETTTNTPRGLYSTHGGNGGHNDSYRSDAGRTSDTEARYPYDSTHGRNRSDVDAVRSGFDDPRNPWDGRYMNDNPANSAVSAGSNGTVNAMQGDADANRYRPGHYGTTAVHRH